MWTLFSFCVIFGVFILYVYNKFILCRTICLLPGRLDDKLIVITGASSGIGVDTAAEVARRGATVIMACRNRDKTYKVKESILKAYGENKNTSCINNVGNDLLKKYLSPIKPDQLIFEEVDLSSLESVRRFAVRVCKQYPKIDILINNAGLISKLYSETMDGFELNIGTNHFGHFLLTELLLSSLKNAAPGSRIINISSVAHYFSKLNIDNINLRGEFWAHLAYAQSKLANAIHAYQLARRLEKYGIVALSVHPGLVYSDIMRFNYFKWLQRFFSRPIFKTFWEGAQTTLYTVLCENIISGGYYSDCALKDPNPLVLDEKIGEQLWDLSMKAVGLS